MRDEIHVCPQCGKEMYLMGRTFKAPKQHNIKQWKKVEYLVRNGFIFYSGARPYSYSLTTLGNAKHFIESRRIKLLPKKRVKILFKKDKVKSGGNNSKSSSGNSK